MPKSSGINNPTTDAPDFRPTPKRPVVPQKVEPKVETVGGIKVIDGKLILNPPCFDINKLPKLPPDQKYFQTGDGDTYIGPASSSEIRKGGKWVNPMRPPSRRPDSPAFASGYVPGKEPEKKPEPKKEAPKVSDAAPAPAKAKPKGKKNAKRKAKK